MTDKRVEAAARADNPDLWSEAHHVAHMAASPLDLGLVRQRHLAKMRRVLAAADAAVADEAREMVEQLRRLANLACTRRTERERIHGVADLIERMAGLKGE